MEFEEALYLCKKQESKIYRKDWNGKGMYVYYVPAHTIPIEQYRCKGTPEDPTPEEISRGYVSIADHFDMYNAQGLRIIGWEPTQTDMASDQWDLLDDLEIPLEELDRIIPEDVKEMWKGTNNDHTQKGHKDTSQER